MACSTVIVGRRSVNSAVIMLPAECSGYLRNWLIRPRISGVAFFRMRLTTLAGMSSSISTASSTYRSSTMTANSASVAAATMSCCISGSSSANTSAATPLGSVRKASTASSPFSSPRNSAISTSFSSSRASRRALKERFFSSASSAAKSYCRSICVSSFFLCVGGRIRGACPDKKPRKQAPEARRRGKQNQNTQMRACSAHSPLCAPKKSVRKQARSALRPPVVSDPVVCRAIPYFVQRVPKTLPPLSFQFARQHSAPRHSIVRCPARICNPFGHGPASAAKRPRPAHCRTGPLLRSHRIVFPSIIATLDVRPIHA